eukprot:97280_1
MHKNYDDNQPKDKKDRKWINFGEIKKLAQEDMEKNYKNQKLIVIEHDNELDQITFQIPKDRGRSHRKNDNIQMSQYREIHDFLSKKCGLPDYAKLFAKNGNKTLKSIKGIKDNDLKQLGISIADHRKKIIKQIKKK